MIQENVEKNTKEIVIPTRIRRRKTPHAKEYYHFELQSSTKNLLVYKCVETGHTECFRKLDFIGKNEYKEKSSKYAG